MAPLRRSMDAAIAVAALALAALPASSLTTSPAAAMPLAQTAALRDTMPSAKLRVMWVPPICTMRCVLWQYTFGLGPQCHIWKKVCSGSAPTHPRYMDFPPTPPSLPGGSHSQASDPRSTKAPDLLHRGLFDREPTLPQMPTVSPRSHAVSTPSSTPPLR